MEIKEQSGLRQVLAGTPIPKMCRVRQIFKRDEIEDIPAYLREKLDNPELRSRIKPGMRVVLTGSSRQIANMPVILRELATFVKEQGAQPYIIPAMGSHGGATDEGQRQILESYGITEEFCGCPIFSSMETVRVGEVLDGDEVRMDKFAHDADAVIVVGRIKGHTAFRGPYESGLIKMMAIGMGKRAGADSLHKEGFGKMGERLPVFAKAVFDSCNVIFGVAPIENEFDQTCRIEVIPAEEIFEKEPDLLLYAKSRMPRLLIPETDVLMVHEIGKNFSGSGMDPNVTGTFGTPFASGGIQKQREKVAGDEDAAWMEACAEQGRKIRVGYAGTGRDAHEQKLQPCVFKQGPVVRQRAGVGELRAAEQNLPDDKAADHGQLGSDRVFRGEAFFDIS